MLSIRDIETEKSKLQNKCLRNREQDKSQITNPKIQTNPKFQDPNEEKRSFVSVIGICDLFVI